AAEEDHPWATNLGRMQHQDEVEAAATAALGGMTRADLFREGQEVWRVPVGAALRLDEVLRDRHLEARGFWRPLAGARAADGSPLRVPGAPFRLVGEERPAERPPEPPGASADDVPRAVAPAARPARTTRDGRPATRPLRGVRVVDLTRIWSGPLA